MHNLDPVPGPQTAVQVGEALRAVCLNPLLSGSIGMGNFGGNQSLGNFCCVSRAGFALFPFPPFSFCFFPPPVQHWSCLRREAGLGQDWGGDLPVSLLAWSLSGAQADLGLGQACFPRAWWDGRYGGWRGLRQKGAWKLWWPLWGRLVCLQGQARACTWAQVQVPAEDGFCWPVLNLGAKVLAPNIPTAVHTASVQTPPGLEPAVVCASASY